MAILRGSEIKSPYDLRETLWYIIPGATLLLLIVLFEYWFVMQVPGIGEYNNLDRIDIVSKYTTNGFLRHSTLKETIEKYAIEDIKKRDSLVTNTIIRSSHLDSLTREFIKTELNENIHTPIFTALSITLLGQKELFKDNWVLAAILLLILFTVCYILGHITYMIGSFVYERMLVSKGYAYPYLKLLKLDEHEQKNTIEIEASQGFYRGIFFWIAGIYLLIYLLFPLYGGIYPENNEFILWILKFLNKGKVYLILSLVMVCILIPLRLKHLLGYLTDWKLNKKN